MLRSRGANRALAVYWAPACVFGLGGLVGWNRCRARHLIYSGAPGIMELSLHANATTTPKVRGYIQRSKRSVAELAAELGVSETTIRRWRGRTSITDRSHTPKTLAISLSPLEEALVCELRTRLQLPLDDITEAAALRQRQALPQRHPPFSGPPWPQPAAQARQAYNRHVRASTRRLHPCRSQASARFGKAQEPCLRRHRPGYPIRLPGDPSQTRCRYRRRLPQALPRSLPASRPHDPHRQRQRAHRSIRRRHERQTP